MFTLIAIDAVNTAACRPEIRMDLHGDFRSDLASLGIIQIPTRYNRSFRAGLSGRPGPWAIRDCGSLAEAVAFLEDRYVASRRIVCC